MDMDDGHLHKKMLSWAKLHLYTVIILECLYVAKTLFMIGKCGLNASSQRKREGRQTDRETDENDKEISDQKTNYEEVSLMSNGEL